MPDLPPEDDEEDHDEPWCKHDLTRRAQQRLDAYRRYVAAHGGDHAA